MGLISCAGLLVVITVFSGAGLNVTRENGIV